MQMTKGMLRAALLSSAAAGLFAPNLAQAQAKPAGGQAVGVEEIVVTGSRIRRDTFNAPLPMATVDAAQLRQSGHVILGDALMEIPQIDATSNAQNTSSSLFNSGQARVDIRAWAPAEPSC